MDKKVFIRPKSETNGTIGIVTEDMWMTCIYRKQNGNVFFKWAIILCLEDDEKKRSAKARNIINECETENLFNDSKLFKTI